MMFKRTIQKCNEEELQSDIEKYSINTVPVPPLPPEQVCKGFNSDGYWELIQSLPSRERENILNELESPRIIAKAEQLEQKLAKDIMNCAQLDTPRDMFLAALLCLQQNKISKNQLATLHLVDSAIRTLYTSPCCYLIHSYVKDHKAQRTFNVSFPVTTNLPTEMQRCSFDSVMVPDSKTTIENLPERMRYPLIRRFFNFTDTEWINFSCEMLTAPISETYVYILVTPEYGCWSSLVSKVQTLLKCMQILDWFKVTDEGYFLEKIMVIPTFSMFQAAINAKANTLNRSSLKLAPTYYYMEGGQYHHYKTNSYIPMTMYMPESEPQLRYHSTRGKFRTNIDGHPAETAFAGAIHDAYHAFRELQISENVSAARLRLVLIAKNHPKDKLSPTHRAISDILMDGELIYSYDLAKNTLFNNDFRPQQKQSFGDIFYVPSVKNHLHDSLKYAFIHDMVLNKDDWFENFSIGRDDLFVDDQKIYDDIERELNSMKTGAEISITYTPLFKM